MWLKCHFQILCAHVSSLTSEYLESLLSISGANALIIFLGRFWHSLALYCVELCCITDVETFWSPVGKPDPILFLIS